MPVWQRDYYDHIIRDDKDYLRIFKYILDNPARWEHDKDYSTKMENKSVKYN